MGRARHFNHRAAAREFPGVDIPKLIRQFQLTPPRRQGDSPSGSFAKAQAEVSRREADRDRRLEQTRSHLLNSILDAPSRRRRNGQPALAGIERKREKFKNEVWIQTEKNNLAGGNRGAAVAPLRRSEIDRSNNKDAKRPSDRADKHPKDSIQKTGCKERPKQHESKKGGGSRRGEFIPWCDAEHGRR